MGVKFYKPTSPARRLMTGYDFAGLSDKKPERKLIFGKKKISAHSSSGRISVRFRGGGHKRKIRQVEFSRKWLDVPAKVMAIEYDPNRSARLALLSYSTGIKSYILAPLGLKVGDTVTSGKASEIKVGNCLPLRSIPLGIGIHNIELKPGKGAQIVRAAGGTAQIVAKEKKNANVRMPSGEIRLVDLNCMATIGQVGNVEHELIRIGKAGRARWLGIRPHNRGVSMNPIDHPHGGGEGKTSGGRHPVSPWGVPAKGYKTRNNKRTDSVILKKRKKK
ncbi:MAG: 50S ribosomal protein L2 [Deltaproteobacteria bacterium]|nr:MAG: 50S ribosomal protein L2 [Deltaproteobacteria bacterium]